MSKSPSLRPGGRSERIRAAVFEAIEELVADNPDQPPSMGAIATRAGVNPTSLYRRWGDANILIAEVAVDRLMRDFPVPDTGSLRGDLIAWASTAARSLSGRKNSALLRIMTANAQANRTASDAASLPIGRRLQELETMLSRASDRGEPAPTVWEILEIVLAPIYLRILYLGPIEGNRYVDMLINRLFLLSFAQNNSI